ncbi:MAG: glutathione S-transferase family protein [Alphaproteobacteria bacterium]|jgi:glutathione S-transferase|nr:glutathione S-transferase family protein [Alphaproteobacteria bacterium]MDP6564222.1 glutathione S-transferase family protein [Alphaproteobacteria bacterium]MDP6816320.1 glutathione S-transferase family protein [Alphaproteobacteria bacterium]|tara:strand:- start:341 stop:1030 length:690 start_codon:yes stop_codon:yes gene_type:complete
MAIDFYDLAGRDGRCFSPYCWRVRMALAHKGLAISHLPTVYAGIAGIGAGDQKTLPVIDDGGRVIGDSWVIAQHLEDSYPDQPSLFGGPGGRALSLFVHDWAAVALHGNLIRLLIKDIHDHVDQGDRAYFRASREKAFGARLEDIQAGREDRLAAFREALTPLRLSLRRGEFLGGAAPLYADYIVFGAFQWARTISDFRVLAEDDPIFAWYQRCGGLFDGLASKAPGYY